MGAYHRAQTRFCVGRIGNLCCGREQAFVGGLKPADDCRLEQFLLAAEVVKRAA